MTTGDLLNTLASKCGLQNDESLISLLSNSEFANHEISDEFAGKLNTGLMSLEGAKNSSAVLNHFKPIILKGADDKFAILAAKYGFDADFADEKNTYKKIDLLESKLAAKIAEAEAKAAQTGGAKNEEVQKLNSTIAELQKQLQTLSDSKDKELEKYKAESARQQLEFLINLELNGKHYANSELGDTNIEIARAILNKELASNNAVVVNENGTLKLKQADNQSLDYIDGGYKAVSFSDFINRILADKHLLEVSDDTNGGAGWNRQFQARQLVEGDADTVHLDAATAASLSDLDD